MQQPDCGGCDQRCLLGRLRKYRVTSGERRAHLADEYRKREIPRTDADHRPERFWLTAVRKLTAKLLRVIAAEVDRLAHLGESIRQRLAGFTHCEPDQF